MTTPDGHATNRDGLAHLSEGEVAGYLDHDLTPDERRRVETHIDECASCRAEMIALSQITRADVPAKAVAHRVRWWMPAAAAVVVAALALPSLTSNARVPGSTERAPRVTDSDGRPRFAIVSPADDSTATTPLVFTWRAATADVYRISVLAEAGDPVWTAETNDTTIALPGSIPLETGRLYFWYVEGIANGIVASTGVHRLQVNSR